MNELQTVRPKTGEMMFLVMAGHAAFCIFNSAQRNAVYGEFYKLRFMKRTGRPLHPPRRYSRSSFGVLGS
jgi:hypothetical protein